MSSKNLNKKSDNNNNRAEEQALKEAEIVAELAPNERTRKEAEKLIETVQDDSATTVHEQEQEAIETVLGETKRAIKKTVSEAKREIPKYTEAIGQVQEETIQATKEIGYDLIELQREAASLVPKFQERFMSYYVPWANSKLVTEYYSRMVDGYVDNVISATNLVNSLVVFNMESIQRLADSTKEYWKVGVENAKAINDSIKEE